MPRMIIGSTYSRMRIILDFPESVCECNVLKKLLL